MEASDSKKNEVDKNALESVRKTIAEGLLAIESSLYSALSFESGQIGKKRDAISKLEEKLLDPEEIEKLGFRDKMALHSLLRKAQFQTLDFLYTLHQSVPSITENLGILDRLNKEIGGSEPDDLNGEDKSTVRMIRSMLLDSLRRRHRAAKELPKPSPEMN